MNSYMAVIDIIAHGYVDFTEIGRVLASEHPDIFLRLHRAQGWLRKLDRAVKVYNAGKIASIKLVKDWSGMGLKDAKLFVEERYPNNWDYDKGMAASEYTSWTNLPGEVKP